MAFSSPYNFIPLSNTVHFPIWQNMSYDAPNSEALSGTISFEVTNLNSLIIGDYKPENENIQPFFKTPDGLPSIPGTSIKGVMRSLIEAATASYISVDDNLFAQRDLTSANNEYMTALKTRKAGWLKYSDQKDWYIQPCKNSYQTIRHTSGTNRRGIDTEITLKEKLNIAGFDKIETATERYGEILKRAPQKKRIGVNIELIKDYYLVVTNQLEGSTKKREFLFSPPDIRQTKEKPISDQVMQSFLKVMDESQTEVGAKHWAYLKPQANEGIPVFYLQDTNTHQVTKFGLPSLFRLPYNKSIHALLPPGQRDKSKRSKLDFAMLLFGEIAEDDATHISRKGRVSFSLAKLSPNERQKVKFEIQEFILSNPKPSFYPAYLKQTKGDKLKSFNTSFGIRGSKVYLPKKNLKLTVAPTVKGKTNTDVLSKVEVLTSTHPFKGKIRFHNALPEEIGAILWALTLNPKGETGAVHLLGMGKPLGFGKVTFNITDINLQPINSQAIAPNKQTLIEYFLNYLAANNLLTTETMASIISSHKEGVFPDAQLQYLKMDLDNKINQFEDVIKNQQSLDSIPIKEALNQLQQFEQQHASEIKKIKEHIQKAQELEEERQKAAQRQAQEEEEREKQLEQENSLEPFEKVYKEIMDSKVTKTSLQALAKQPDSYQSLPDDQKEKLKTRIITSDWYKGLNAKVRKKYKKLLQGLL